MTVGEKYAALAVALRHHRNTRGEWMDFRHSSYLLALYMHADEMPKIVVEKCVQSGISELLIILAHIEAARGLRIIYMLPVYEIRDRFVSNRISRLHSTVSHQRNLVAEAKGAHRKSFMDGAIGFVGSMGTPTPRLPILLRI